METFTVYAKIFNTKKKFIISNEDITSQSEAENYTLNVLIPKLIRENVTFYDTEKVKENTLKNEQTKDKKKENKERLNKSFDKVLDSFDNAFAKMDNAFAKIFDMDKKK